MRRTLDDLAALPRCRVVPDDELLDFVRLHAPRGIGWVDAQLLVSALQERARIWTRDAGLAKMAARFDVAWSTPRLTVSVRIARCRLLPLAQVPCAP